MAFVSFKFVAAALFPQVGVSVSGSASAMATVLEYTWPPPPTISLRHLLLVDATRYPIGPIIETPEITPPFEESCTSPIDLSPPDEFLDPASFSYSENSSWLSGSFGPFSYDHAEGRLVSWLRSAAQLADPIEILKLSAISFFCVGLVTRSPLDTAEGAAALADLAVTGRFSWSTFSQRPMLESDIISDVRDRVSKIVNATPDETRLSTSVNAALDRAFLVAWALRDTNPVTRAVTRSQLGWIAVSGEDDAPHRPVNLASAPFPQYDILVTGPNSAAGDPVPVVIRYMIALPNPIYVDNRPSFPTRVLPVETPPSIPDDHEVILFIHGMDSRCEEAADLLNPPLNSSLGPLLQAGLDRGKKYAVICFDLPTNGYSEKIAHETIAQSDATTFTSLPGGSPATYPLLDWLVDFVVSFVDTVDAQLNIKNRVAIVIGGSLGGNLSLRLAEKTDQPWIKNVVAWSPGSVWSSFNHDQIKWGALNAAKNRMQEAEEVDPDDTPMRVHFFYESFDTPAGPGTPTQPKMWYRDSWPCQSSYIADDRIERSEIYSAIFRRWRWRVGLEQLLFSHLNTDTPGGKPRYASNVKRTLLLAGHEDDYNWANIYTATRDLAGLMLRNGTPGESVFLLNTGHSIHNERPLFLSQQIVNFITT